MLIKKILTKGITCILKVQEIFGAAFWGGRAHNFSEYKSLFVPSFMVHHNGMRAQGAQDFDNGLVNFVAGIDFQSLFIFKMSGED